MRYIANQYQLHTFSDSIMADLRALRETPWLSQVEEESGVFYLLRAHVREGNEYVILEQHDEHASDERESAHYRVLGFVLSEDESVASVCFDVRDITFAACLDMIATTMGLDRHG